MKYVAFAVIVAAIPSLAALPAAAADVGGDCCSDLEERIATLEASSVTSGNRKITVTLSGEVDSRLVYTALFGLDDIELVTHAKINIAGEGTLRPGAMVGFRIETSTDAGFDLAVDKANIWIDGAAGRITFGALDQASHGVGDEVLTNTEVVAKLLDVPFLGAVFDGVTIAGVRYDSPSLGGFTASASWSEGSMDGALRFAHEAGGLRFAAGIGYRVDAVSTFNPAEEQRTIIGSASAKHMPSGVFVQGAYAVADFNTDTVDLWHVQGGVEKDVIGIGATTLYAEYGSFDGNVTGWGVGIVQNAGALDMFASYRLIEGDLTVVLAGARVKF